MEKVHKSKGGFTILEIIISLAISLMLIGAIVGVIFMNFSSYSQSSKANARIQWLSMNSSALEKQIKSFVPVPGAELSIFVEDNCLKMEYTDGSSGTTKTKLFNDGGISYGDIPGKATSYNLTVDFEVINGNVGPTGTADNTINYTLHWQEDGNDYEQSGSVWLAHNSFANDKYFYDNKNTGGSAVPVQLKNMEVITSSYNGSDKLTMAATP